MNILFDGILLQTFINGAAAYTYKVFTTLHQIVEKQSTQVNIYILYDSKKQFIQEYAIDSFVKRGDMLVDVQQYNGISKIIDAYDIHSFFIGCLQYYSKYSLENISCHSVAVIHDLFDCELNENRLPELMYDDFLCTKKHRIYLALLQILKIFNKQKSFLSFDYSKLIDFYNQPNVESVTVSKYSEEAIRYFFPQVTKPIHVLYSPHKVVNRNEQIDNVVIRNLIKSNYKFYLLVSANRWTKNARMAIDTFLKKEKNAYIVTIGYPKSLGKNHIVCPFLSESDLDYLFQHAYALIYPSLEEGFGYPPIEAMRWGTPVISSNVCSMPEICGEAALYFSPIHHTSLSMQLDFLDKHYDEYVKKSLEQYKLVAQHQEQDLKKIIDLILNIK